MSSPSSSDCYLCGAQNEADASYCARCNGQLLRIPVEEEHEDSIDADVEGSSDEALEDQSSDDGETGSSSRRRRTRKGTLQDQRLSDALGLDTTIEHDGDDPDDGNLVDTVVTSIPRATPAADIPMIGTRPGVIPQASMSERDFGKKTFAVLAVLVLLTGWFGYRVLFSSDEKEPDSIAFTGTTTTSSTSSTTTVTPRRVWQISEVDARYKSTFVRVAIYECSSELEVGTTREPIAETLGVSLNTHSVLVGGLVSGDVAAIRNRTGARRVGLIERTAGGAMVATSTRATSRNLGLDQAIDSGSPAFYVGYDPETNIVSSSRNKLDASAEIAASKNGDALTVFLEGRSYDLSTLRDVDTRVEIDPEIGLKANATPCETFASLRPVVPEGAEIDSDATMTEAESGTDDATPEEE